METVLSQEGEDGSETAVTFNIDLSEMRRERFTQMGLRGGHGLRSPRPRWRGHGPGFGSTTSWRWPAGSVAAGGIFALERRRYFESRSRVALAPERFLDLLALRQKRRSLPGDTEE